ncbi:hypothetical protein N7491_009412 [Penicillium cf. griseofulvum]|nr:hypothetical protein N7491_009412 [Penicillium cf. griseofulvum]
MHPSSFAKRSPLASRLRSKTRPPPPKSCLATSCSERDLPLWRTLRSEDILKPPIFKRAQITKTKSFIMYTSDSMGSNQRFLYRIPGRNGPRHTIYSHWMSVIRARHLAAAYSAEPRSPRSAPSFVASLVPNAAFGVHSPRSAVSEPAPAGSPQGFAFGMSSPSRALPGDASSDVSSLAHVPKSMVTSHLSPEARCARVVQTHVEVGPFSVTSFFRLCGLFLVVGSVFPWMVPVFYAVLVLLFVYGKYFS